MDSQAGHTPRKARDLGTFHRIPYRWRDGLNSFGDTPRETGGVMSQKLTFQTINAAVGLGFVPAGPRQYQAYKGCSIYGFPNGIGGARGHSYSLRVEVPEDFTNNYFGVNSEQLFGLSMEVMILGGSVRPDGAAHRYGSASGLGKDGSATKQGKVALMFEPSNFMEAIASARDWTDKWFRAHPDAWERANELHLAQRRQERLARA